MNNLSPHHYSIGTWQDEPRNVFIIPMKREKMPHDAIRMTDERAKSSSLRSFCVKNGTDCAQTLARVAAVFSSHTIRELENGAFSCTVLAIKTEEV